MIPINRKAFEIEVIEMNLFDWSLVQTFNYRLSYFVQTSPFTL